MKKYSKLFDILDSIKFPHTIFALPFALMATILAKKGSSLTFKEGAALLAAMVGARTWAMGINRIADHRLDAENPRTQNRALPAGRIKVKEMLLFSGIFAVIFIIAAGALSKLALYFSLPVLLFLAMYSYTKRFTFFCHFWLGMALGMAPIGAWIALRNEFSIPILFLGLAVCFWVSGFDILYALQDVEFDRNAKLHSIPAKFGIVFSLRLSRFLHLTALGLFIYVGMIFGLGKIYFLGCFLAAILMFYEHWLLRKADLSKLELAFFNLNGWVAVLLFFSSLFSI